MIRFKIILLISLLAITAGYSQNDPYSKSILDKVASTSNRFKTIKVDYKFSSVNAQSKESHSETGKLWMKGDRYHLTLSNSDIIFDGKSIYTYVKESNEINITKPEPSKIEQGDFFFSNPRDLFKGYNKNFKSQFIKETNINNIPCYEIDLYPIDLKTRYIRLKMHILKSNDQIADITMFLKDGTKDLIEFSNFISNTELPDKEFVFDPQKFPKAEVNDMRF